MRFRTTFKGGVKHVIIDEVSRGDSKLVIPFLMLQGMSRHSASDGFDVLMKKGNFVYDNSGRNVSVHCLS